VDDNNRARNLLTKVLEQRGFDVMGVSDPGEALRICRESHFDLALLDYPVPIISGQTLAAEIKFFHPEVPIVLISGRVAISEHDLIFVDAHLGAGTSLEELIATMRMLLAYERVSRSELAVPRHWSDST
jgi:DNA-binding response OmpR family regulator